MTRCSTPIEGVELIKSRCVVIGLPPIRITHTTLKANP
jgi:hypothetical protein